MTSNPFKTLGLCLALLLSACGGGHHDGRVTIVVADRKQELKSISEASGAFKDTPYDVKWVDFSAMPPLFEALDAGAVDIATATESLGLQAGMRGIRMKIVAAGDSSGAGDALIVPAGSPIHSVAALKGHLVVVSSIRGGTADAVFVQALAEAGLTEKSVKVSYMTHSDALAAFMSGKIEAWATNDPAYAQAQEGGARLLRDGVGFPKAMTLVMAGDDALANPAKKAAMVDLLGRLAKARNWANADPDRSARAYSAGTGLPAKLAAKMIRRQGRQPFMPIDNAIIVKAQAVADINAARGIYPQKIKVDGYFSPLAFKVDTASNNGTK